MFLYSAWGKGAGFKRPRCTDLFRDFACWRSSNNPNTARVEASKSKCGPQPFLSNSTARDARHAKKCPSSVEQLFGGLVAKFFVFHEVKKSKPELCSPSPGTSSAWRPPCAVGPSACIQIEACKMCVSCGTWCQQWAWSSSQSLCQVLMQSAVGPGVLPNLCGYV